MDDQEIIRRTQGMSPLDLTEGQRLVAADARKREARRIAPDDDDLRRLCLSLLALMKRRFPTDWQKLLAKESE